jgi:hypothetical protein
MRINSRKIRKILGRVWTSPKRILKSFCTHKPLDASTWMQHPQLFIWFRKSNKDFSYTIFPVKKINVGKNLKLWRNHCLIVLSIHILKLEISGCDTVVAVVLIQSLDQVVILSFFEDFSVNWLLNIIYCSCQKGKKFPRFTNLRVAMFRCANSHGDSITSDYLLEARTPMCNLILSTSLNISVLRFPCRTFDHSYYSKNSWKCKNNYDIIKI